MDELDSRAETSDPAAVQGYMEISMLPEWFNQATASSQRQVSKNLTTQAYTKSINTFIK